MKEKMPKKCNHCGKEIIPAPLFKVVDGKKKLQWKSLLYMSRESIIFFILIVYLLWAFQYETTKCDLVIDDPCGFCEDSGCYDYKTTEIITADRQLYFNLSGYNSSIT